MFKRFWWVFLVMLPVGAIGGVLVMAVVSYVMPKQYESQAIIEVKPMPPPSCGESVVPHTTPQYFYATEFEKIKSHTLLAEMVTKLELTNHWGVDQETAIRLLRGMVSTENLQGTDLISIRVRHTDREEARDIAAELAKNYRNYLVEMLNREAERQWNEFNKAVVNQEDKVEERRKVIATIVRTGDFIYTGSDPTIRKLTEKHDEGAKTADQIFHELEQGKMLLESQIKDLPIDDGELDESVVNLRNALKAQLDLATQRLKDVEAMKDASWDGPGRSLDPDDFIDATRDYETDKELLKTMKLKQISATTTNRMQDERVVVREEPQIPQSPVSPNLTLNLVLGAVGGFLLSPLLAFPVVLPLNRTNPVRVDGLSGRV